jgi:hypothetical protein
MVLNPCAEASEGYPNVPQAVARLSSLAENRSAAYPEVETWLGSLHCGLR